MYKYKLSVIMAVYNVEVYIDEAIDSIIKQEIGFENIQLVLIDDGSPDNSPSICDEYVKKYPNNVVVLHKRCCSCTRMWWRLYGIYLLKQFSNDNR